MKELNSKIEAVLFCSPEGIETRKLAKVLGIGSAGHVKGVINKLAEDFSKRKSGLEIVRQGNVWKLKVRSEHADLVKEAARPELADSVLETLAYIAWKGGCSQSSVIKARSNKAYNHLIELEERGFIEKKKNKNSFVIKPTKRFFEYFDLKNGEKLDIGDA